MVVITSNGLSSKQFLGDVSLHTQGLLTAVIVTTASNPLHGDNDLPRLKSELERLHLTVNWFDFDKDDPNELLQYDVVEMSGGDPFYLRESICKAKAEAGRPRGYPDARWRECPEGCHETGSRGNGNQSSPARCNGTGLTASHRQE